jgi:Arc/MetJ-type ribon-helix-helix transcriptional regulator
MMCMDWLLLFWSLQAAIRQAMRAAAAAEAERDALKTQLQEAGVQQEAAEPGQMAAEQQEQLQQENGGSLHIHMHVS